MSSEETNQPPKLTDQELADQLALKIRRYTLDKKKCEKEFAKLRKVKGDYEGRRNVWSYWMNRHERAEYFLERAQPQLAQLVLKGIFPVLPEETVSFRVKRIFGADPAEQNDMALIHQEPLEFEEGTSTCDWCGKTCTQWITTDEDEIVCAECIG